MLFSKVLWSSCPFTALYSLFPFPFPLSPFPINRLVVTSSAQLSPHLCMYKSQVTQCHAVQSLPSVFAFTNIFGANTQSRRFCSSPASIMVRLSSNHSLHASPFSAPGSMCPTSSRTASSIVSTSSLFSQCPETPPLLGAECEDFSLLDVM